MIASYALLIAETHMAEVSLQYREEIETVDRSGLWWLLIPVLAIAVGALIYKFVDRPPAVVNTPLGMLHELCRVHRIKGSARTLLERIAEEAELAQPASMLLGTTQFEEAIQKAGRHIKYDRRQTAQLGMLRRRLFV